MEIPKSPFIRAGSGPILGLFVVVLALTVPTEARAQDAVACGTCHGDREFLVGKAPTPEGEEGLFVPDTLLDKTRHAALACVDCHPGYGAGYPHRVDSVARSCETCHGGVGSDWGRSVHAENVAMAGDAAACVDCHGSHTVYGSEDRRSLTHPLNVAETCGRCHADPNIIGTYFATPADRQARVAVAQYYETVHGSALTDAGLVVSATCDDCHGAHAILPAEDPNSTVNNARIPETCGACHAGVLEVYEGSAHAEALRTGERTSGGQAAPVCVECHTAHEIVRADEPEWHLGIVEECGSCHEHLYETYFETYHGKVTALGSGLAAQCSDCHTAHDMRPATSPESTVHPANLVATCAECHPGANRNFTEYYAHGDHHDRENYPKLFWSWLFMTALLAGVFGFFGAHTLLWLTRVTVDRIRGKPGFEEDSLS